jgi:hypothetical protein
MDTDTYVEIALRGLKSSPRIVRDIRDGDTAYINSLVSMMVPPPQQDEAARKLLDRLLTLKPPG